MPGLDTLSPRQIRDGVRQFQYGIRLRRQIELTYRPLHQTLTFILKLTELPYLPNSHISVAYNIR